MDECIYLSPPDVTQLEEDAIIRAFRSGWIELAVMTKSVPSGVVVKQVPGQW